MNKAFFATVFLVLFVFSHAETFEKAKLRGITSKMSTQALFKSMKGSQFGKTLLSMLTLKFKTSEGQLSALVSVLTQLGDSIQAQQSEDDQNYATNSESLGQSIAGEQDTIADASANLADYQAQLADNQAAHSQASIQLAELQQEQAGLEAALAWEAQKRTGDAASYADRVANEETLVAGLQKVTQLFEGETNNPDLNQESVAEILGLLNNLVTAFQASIAEDTALEQEAIANYDAYVNPRQARLEEVGGLISELQSTIAQLEGVIAQLQDRVASEQVRLNTAEQLLAQFQQQLQDLTERYTSNTATRSQQINLLSIVNARLTQNAEEVQEVLNNA